MEHLVDSSDDELFSLVKEGDVEAFNQLYDRYWEKLFNYVFHRVRTRDEAFEMVQDIFVSIWSRRAEIQIQTSLSGYLFASARFQIIAYIRRSKQRDTYLSDYVRFTSAMVDNSNEESLILSDLQKNLERSIGELPERCREISRLSMLHHWPSDKISEKLHISHRTVENQLALARKHLRVSLGDYAVLYLIFVGIL